MEVSLPGEGRLKSRERAGQVLAGWSGRYSINENPPPPERGRGREIRHLKENTLTGFFRQEPYLMPKAFLIFATWSSFSQVKSSTFIFLVFPLPALNVLVTVSGRRPIWP